VNKRYLVIAVALALVALIALSFVLDCVRLADAARAREELADQELAKHEERLMKALTASEKATPQVQAAIVAYRSAPPPERRAAYDNVVTAFRHSLQKDIDPTDPLARKFMDDVAGAMNRREVAEPAYEAELSAYHQYLASMRGAVARWFSAAARQGWSTK
jgi:uncharacterized protein YPO0396